MVVRTLLVLASLVVFSFQLAVVKAAPLSEETRLKEIESAQVELKAMDGQIDPKELADLSRAVTVANEQSPSMSKAVTISGANGFHSLSDVMEAVSKREINDCIAQNWKSSSCQSVQERIEEERERRIERERRNVERERQMALKELYSDMLVTVVRKERTLARHGNAYSEPNQLLRAVRKGLKSGLDAAIEDPEGTEAFRRALVNAKVAVSMAKGSDMSGGAK